MATYAPTWMSDSIQTVCVCVCVSNSKLCMLSVQYLGPIQYTKTCLYTMTPDRHFVVDKCTKFGWDDVIVCCGAGHVYKYVCTHHTRFHSKTCSHGYTHSQRHTCTFARALTHTHTHTHRHTHRFNCNESVRNIVLTLQWLYWHLFLAIMSLSMDKVIENKFQVYILQQMFRLC
jgi:hypothetical protein